MSGSFRASRSLRPEVARGLLLAYPHLQLTTCYYIAHRWTAGQRPAAFRPRALACESQQPGQPINPLLSVPLPSAVPPVDRRSYGSAFFSALARDGSVPNSEAHSHTWAAAELVTNAFGRTSSTPVFRRSAAVSRLRHRRRLRFSRRAQIERSLATWGRWATRCSFLELY